MEEQLAVRKAVGIIDQSSFGKLLVRGRDALALLERACANRIGVPVGHVVYTPMLNRKGGYESDVTVQRRAQDEFFIVTGSAQPVRDRAWLLRQKTPDEDATVEDVSDAWSVISLLGPKAAIFLGRVRAGRARAVRASYTGGSGFELYVPDEDAASLYDSLCEAGRDLGLRDCGYYALDALRIEAGRRAFGAELSPDCTPYEAGLGFAVRMEKDFIGRSALAERSRDVFSKRLLMFTFPATDLFAWGGEPILRDGIPAGELSSVAYSAALGCMVAMGFVHASEPQSLERFLFGKFEVEVSGRKIAAKASLEAPWRG